jgi:hypothetical protein
MKNIIALLLALTLPATSFARPIVTFEYNSNQKTDRKIPYKPPAPSAAERMRAVEEREIINNTPKEKPISAQEMEALGNPKTLQTEHSLVHLVPLAALAALVAVASVQSAVDLPIHKP